MAHREYTFGVSLGSTNAVIALSQGTTERQDVCADDNGERSTPIAVGFVNGEEVTGLTAKNAIVRHPRNVLAAIIPLISKEASVHTSGTKISSLVEIDESGKVTLPNITEKETTPVELLDTFMVKLKELLVNATGDAHVTAVTIAVPRHVDQEAILAAAKKAELVNKGAALRIVADDAAIAMTALPQLRACEITEAKIAENVDGHDIATKQQSVREENGTVIVIDWGAQTLAVNALHLNGGVLTHVAGDRKVGFGGAALDKKISQIAADGFQKKTRCDASDDARAMRKLAAASEQTKIALSQCMVSSIEIDAFSNGADLVEPIQRMRLDMAFDMLGGNLQLKNMLEAVVAEAKKKTGDAPLHSIVLSGGQVRVPRCLTQVKNICALVLPDVKIAQSSILANEVAAVGACQVATALQHETGVWTAGARVAPTLSYNLVVGAAADKVDAAASTTIVAAGAALPITVELTVGNHADNKEFGLAVGMAKKAGDKPAWFGAATVKSAVVSVTVKDDGEVVVTEGKRSALELKDLKVLASFKP